MDLALLREATAQLESAGSPTPQPRCRDAACSTSWHAGQLRCAPPLRQDFHFRSQHLLSFQNQSRLVDRHPHLADTLRIARSALAAGDAPAALAALVKERATGRPISHLTGRRGFRRLELLVTPDVLDPRPESELIIETALAYSCRPRCRRSRARSGPAPTERRRDRHWERRTGRCARR